MGKSELSTINIIENAIFVADILSKTRNGGLPWVYLSPNLYMINLCEPPECLLPKTPTNSWTLYVGKNQANDESLSYVYYLDVVLDAQPFLSMDSRSIGYVQQLFQMVEVSNAQPHDFRTDRVLQFLGEIPTSPRSDSYHVVMCGGISVTGGSVVKTNTHPTNSPASIKVDGSSVHSIILSAKTTIAASPDLSGDAA